MDHSEISKIMYLVVFHIFTALFNEDTHKIHGNENMQMF